MSYILGLDTSYAQGTNIDYQAVKDAGYSFVLQRMSYSYPGQPGKFDTTAAQNYRGFQSVGMVVGGYHKIGWTDPIVEADLFLSAMSPLAENDLLAHDMEPSSDVPIPPNWSEFEQAYVKRIYDRTGIWSIRYENISMNNSMPKQGVVVNCPSWVAAPSFSWDATLPVSTVVVIQQGPTVRVPGIPANVCDTDAFFGEGGPEQLLDELRKLGYHAPEASTPMPTPPSAPSTSPAQTDTSPTPPTSTLPTQIPVTIITATTSIPVSTSSANHTEVTIPGTPSTVVSTSTSPDSHVVSGPTTPTAAEPTVKDHTLDVIVRSIKTYAAIVVAIASAGGLDIIHLSPSQNLKVSGIGAVATALLNIGIKLYNASKSTPIS